MNLIKVIENIEIERDNNKKLGEAICARLRTMREHNQALLTQAQEFVRQLDAQAVELHRAIEVTAQEFADRDEALMALIGSE